MSNTLRVCTCQSAFSSFFKKQRTLLLVMLTPILHRKFCFLYFVEEGENEY